MIRRLLLALALLLLVVLSAAGWLGWRGLQARDALTAGRADLTQARSALLDQRPAQAQQFVASAGVHTRRAHQLTSDPLWRAAAALPLAGHTVAVVRGLASAADLVARGALPPALEAAQALEPARVRRPDGSLDLAAVARSQPPVARLDAVVGQAQQQIRALPSGRVLPAVEHARAQLIGQVDVLAQAARSGRQVVELLPPLLGADKPRRYFVLVQQTSESRGTGGLPGGFAILEVDRGRLRVSAQGTDAELVNGPIPPPAGVPADYVQLYAPQGAFDLWQNVNVSPDLPVVARVVAARWKRQSGQSVDGVIALDALALADLLRGSGPIDVGGASITADTIPDFLAIGQYVGVPPVSSAHRARKERLTEVARLASQRLTSGGGSSAELLRGLSSAVRSGHLRMASDDPALAGLHAAGVDGALPSGAAPLAYPVIVNASGGKLDYFLDRAVHYEAGPCGKDRRGSEIVVDVTNRAPARGLPPYLTILLDAGGQHDSTTGAVLLSVYATRGARLFGATLDGAPLGGTPDGGRPFLSEGSASGVPVWYLYLRLPRGQTRRLVLDLTEPTAAGAPRVPTQPLARPLQISTDAVTCR